MEPGPDSFVESKVNIFSDEVKVKDEEEKSGEETEISVKVEKEDLSYEPSSNLFPTPPKSNEDSEKKEKKRKRKSSKCEDIGEKKKSKKLKL